MANTTIGSVATTSIVAKGTGVYEWGTVSGSSNRLRPGYCQVKIGSSNSYALHTGISPHILRQPRWIDFEYRTSSTFGEVDIDTDYSADKGYAKLLNPYASSDDIEWWAFCIDMSGTKYPGEALLANSTGQLILAASGLLSSALTTCVIAPDYIYSSGDKVVKVAKP